MLYSSKPYINEEMINAAKKSLEEEFFVGGKSVELFEEEFAEYIGTAYAIAVASGTDALVIALRCLNIKNTVITTPISFVATAESIVLVNGKPKFVDIDSNTWNINPEKIQSAIDEDTEAIMPVHLYGQPCNMKKIMDIAEDNHLYVIEDCAQSHGAIFNEKKVGCFGEANAFSFYSTKNMTVCGNGGMITTNDKRINDKAKLLREHGGAMFAKYIGYNARMNTVNAAIGRIQLKYLDEWNKKRRNLSNIYFKELQNIEEIKLPFNDKNAVYHLFVIEAKNRYDLREHLKSKNIFCGIHYPIPIHQLEPYKIYVVKKQYPISEYHISRNISLPMYPILKEEEVKMVCDEIKSFYGGDN